MAEVLAGKAFPVSLIWLDLDWPDAPPLADAANGPSASIERDAYGLSGLSPAQPVLSMATIELDGLCALSGFIAQYLSPAAQRRLAQGDAGVAIFGRRGRGDQLLRSGDRIELLGPIKADPKSNRRKRVKADRDARDRDKWRSSRSG